MRRLVCLAAAVLAAPAFAQAVYWDWEQPLPTGDTFNDVAPSSVGFDQAVGTGGSIYLMSSLTTGGTFGRQAPGLTSQTLNVVSWYGCGSFCVHSWIGGNGGVLIKNTGSYALVNSPTTDNIVGLSFVDDNNGWLVTSTGFIWHTNNGGVNWTSQVRPVGASALTSVLTLSSVNAFITRAISSPGHALIKTSDATNWADVASTPTTYNRVVGLSTTQLVLSGPGGALTRYNATTDAFTAMDAGTTQNIRDLVDQAGTAYGIADPPAGGRHSIFGLSTSTGAVTPWPTPMGVPVGMQALGVSGSNIVGQGGLVEFTSGSGWSMVSSGNTLSTFRGVVLNGTSGIVVGDNGGGKGVARPRSGGSWGAETVIDGGTLSDVVLDSAGVAGWAADNNGLVFYSSNIVTNPWLGTPTNNTQPLNSIALLPGTSPAHLVAVGNQAVVRLTANAGTSWSTPTVSLADGGVPNASITPLQAVAFPTSMVGYTGGGNFLFKTTNGGTTWNEIAPGQIAFYGVQAIHFYDANNGMVVLNYGLAAGGEVMTTTNGGTSWTTHPLPNPPCGGFTGFLRVYMASPTTAWVLHKCGGVTVTTDMGVTWSPFPSPWTGRNMYGLGTLGGGNKKDLWSVGELGSILRTKCGGDPSVQACDDGNPCTDDSCNLSTGACTNANNTKPCNDNSVCTQTDTCSGGMCVGSSPMNCSDGNVCTTDTCDPVMGCKNTAVGMSMSCDDGNSCTSNDVCVGSMCQGTGTVCNNGNACQTGNCGADGGCVYSNKTNGVACTDNNLCTSGDSCQNGTCTGATVMCGDTNSCTDDSCVPTSGCMHNAHVGGCSTGNLCITGQACSGTSCGGGSAVNCDDNDPCTDDTCAPDAGCAHAFRGVNATCDDGKACTLGDVCIADGGCRGAPNTCSDGNSCTQDLCFEPGGCLNPLLPTGTTCSDGNACTTGDSCSDAGVCAGFGMMCDDQNPCTTDSCSPGMGCIATPLPDHSACNDGNDCNTGDHCETGRCVADAGLNCDDNNPCTLDVCNSGTGNVCAHPVRDGGTLCSDDNACTDNDHCTGVMAMGCVGTPLTCDDHNGCTADTCDVATGCANTNLDAGTACNDGNACTSNETCDGLGTCFGPQNCTPSDMCMNATCEPDGGQCTMTPKMDPMCMGTGGGGGSGGGAGGGSAATGGGSGATGGGIAQGGGSAAGGTAQGGGSNTGGGEGGGTAGGGMEKPSIFQPGCGCDGGGGAATLLLALVTLARRRRRS